MNVDADTLAQQATQTTNEEALSEMVAHLLMPENAFKIMHAKALVMKPSFGKVEMKQEVSTDKQLHATIIYCTGVPKNGRRR